MEETVSFLVGILVALILWLGCIAIASLKGHHGLAAVGVFLPPVAMFGAFRLAKPDSWWARKYYDVSKMEAAWARYPELTL